MLCLVEMLVHVYDLEINLKFNLHNAIEGVTALNFLLF